MKWFRLYHELLDDPKVQRLEPELFKFWINFLCLANRSEARGVVDLEPEAIAFALRVSDEEAQKSLTELARLGLIEPVETGLKPHNWDDRQRKSDDVTARVTAHRNAKTVNETLQETLQETLHETPSKQNGNVPSSARTRAPEKELEREKEKELRPVGNKETENDVGSLCLGAANADATRQSGTKSTSAKRKHQLPDDFAIDDELVAYGESLGLRRSEIDAETEKFRLHHRAKGTVMIDWRSAWKGWMRRAPEFRANASRLPTSLPPPLRAETYNGNPVFDYRGNPTTAYFLRQVEQLEAEERKEQASS